MPPYDSEPLDHSLELHELHYQLTLIQHWAHTSNANQVQVAAPGGGGNFGETIANDWDLEDPCQNGKIVAHAKGLHILASRSDGGNCHTSFDIVFEQGSGYVRECQCFVHVGGFTFHSSLCKLAPLLISNILSFHSKVFDVFYRLIIN